MTFHHGAVNVGWNPPKPIRVPEPPRQFADRALGGAGPGTFILDLHAPTPDAVQAWLNAPAKLRVIGPSYEPANDADYHMSGGSLAQWFDAIIRLEEVTPTRLQPPGR